MLDLALTDDERARLQELLKNPYFAFQQRYKHDRAAFVRDCFTWQAHERPHPYQLEILDLLTQHGRECVRALHGVGKTAIAAQAVLHFALTRDGWSDWKCPTTAGSWAQLERYLWPEIHKWARRLRWDRIGRPAFTAGELLYQKLKLSTGEAFAVASDQPELMEGAHASSMFYLLDEAKAIPNRTWDAVEGAFSQEGLVEAKKEAFALAISTPGPPVGRFYDIQKRKPGYEDWHRRHVTLREATACGQVSAAWAEARRLAWGETSAVYKNRVLGEFAADDSDGIIPLVWVDAAIERWRQWKLRESTTKASYVGVDVARGGDDKNTFALLVEEDDVSVIAEVRRIEQRQDTMQTTGQVAGIMRAEGATPVIDVLNMGAGVVDRLRELTAQELDDDGTPNELYQRPVMAFNASVSVKGWRDKLGEFAAANLRSAGWWTLRERLDPSSPAKPVALPDDDMLIGDLTAIRQKTLSGGVIAVEPKENLKKQNRLGRSPDTGDAVMQVLAHALVDPEEHFGLGDDLKRDSQWTIGKASKHAPHLSPLDW